MKTTLLHPTAELSAPIRVAAQVRAFMAQAARIRMRMPSLPYSTGFLFLLGVQLQANSVIQFSAVTYNVTESTSQVEIAVQRTNDLDSVRSVDFATTNLTATADADYVDVVTNLLFLAGQTTQIMTVSILNDGLLEGLETFQVLLNNPSDGAELGSRSNATVRITSNDTELQVEFAQYQAREDEGSVLIGVTRGDDGDFPVAVEYATADGTAKAGTDYTTTTGKLEFAAGEKVKLFTIPIPKDGLKEANKRFSLSLNNAIGMVLGIVKSATITIVDNDPGVQFDYSTYWVSENEREFTVRILRGNDIELGAFTVDYATSDATALAGLDYVERRGTLEFAAGELVKFLTIPILSDELVELDEKFTVTLSHSTGPIVLGSNAKASVSILDMTGMAPHRFEGLRILPDQSVQLALSGAVHKRFQSHFDLYPLEVSTNLEDWTSLVTLQRTNAAVDTLIHFDARATTFDRQFYRMVTNHLITALLKPTGLFPVGVVSRLVQDPSRRNRFFVSTNGSFMASIWYPAIAEAGRPPVPYEDEMLMRDSRFPVSVLQRSLYTFAHAQWDARCATRGVPYPVVIYSHGWTVGRTCQVVGQAENLASHGYVVVSMDHFDARFSRFPDGTCRFGDVREAGLAPAGFRDRVRDVQVILDELARWNLDDPILAGCLELTKVAAMGLSWGGGTAAEAGRIDSRIRAAVILDPAISSYSGHAPDLLQLGLQKPLITMHSTELGASGNFYDKAVRDAVFFVINPSQHVNLGDSWWWELTSPNYALGQDISRTIRAYTLWFLNKYLKGLDEPLPTKAEYPRVLDLRQK